MSEAPQNNYEMHEDAEALEVLEDAQEQQHAAFAATARSSRVRLTDTMPDAEYEHIDAAEWLRHRMERDWWPAVTHTLWLHRRGPDVCQTTPIQLPVCYADANITLSAAVLALRLPVMHQPSLQSHSYFAYNGELYEAPSVSGLAAVESDTTRLHQLFDAVSAPPTDHPEPSSRIFDRIQSAWVNAGEVEGAWIWIQPAQGRILFAKDALGRRSLLRGKLVLSQECQNHPLYARIAASELLQQMCLISSVALPGFTIPSPQGDLHVDTQWIEVDPHHLHGILLQPRSWSVVRASMRARPYVSTLPLSLGADTVLDCLTLLKRSIRRRVSFLGSVSALGVLYSGGLDSTVLAALADDHLGPEIQIDLINVAFGDTSEDCERAADRIAARQSYRELCARSASPERVRLILVDVTSAMMKQTMERVQHLTLPLNTVMDASIAMPLWFAARGDGRLSLPPAHAVRSTARVMLLGAGADEQFGGYSRHRVAFVRDGRVGLINELKKDMARIWQRNLGRDDRVVADHAREARFPFLDRELRDWLESLPVESICDMTLAPGIGDKQLLRSVAQCLSLPTAATLVKRAVQFGSRLTKMVPKGKGTDKLDQD